MSSILLNTSAGGSKKKLKEGFWSKDPDRMERKSISDDSKSLGHCFQSGFCYLAGTIKADEDPVPAWIELYGDLLIAKKAVPRQTLAQPNSNLNVVTCTKKNCLGCSSCHVPTEYMGETSIFLSKVVYKEHQVDSIMNNSSISSIRKVSAESLGLLSSKGGQNTSFLSPRIPEDPKNPVYYSLTIYNNPFEELFETFFFFEPRDMEGWREHLSAAPVVNLDFFKKFSKGKKISSGGFSTVYLATNVENCEQYAAKVLNIEKFSRLNSTRELLLNEIKILSRIGNCSHVPKLYELHQTEEDIILIIELIKGSCLDQWTPERLSRLADPSQSLNCVVK